MKPLLALVAFIDRLHPVPATALRALLMLLASPALLVLLLCGLCWYVRHGGEWVDTETPTLPMHHEGPQE